ncbi:hypothetical protein [Mesorhizobium sp. 113-1-2]|nr:hypothetical protein [Mesorhizobium sp. 113-1-2]
MHENKNPKRVVRIRSKRDALQAQKRKIARPANRSGLLDGL